MRFSLLSFFVTLPIALLCFGTFFYLITLVIRALRTYLRSSEMRKEKSAVKRSLGETIRAHRLRCQMTQEFLAESLGVSRQAVSKWEQGHSHR